MEAVLGWHILTWITMSALSEDDSVVHHPNADKKPSHEGFCQSMARIGNRD